MAVRVAETSGKKESAEVTSMDKKNVVNDNISEKVSGDATALAHPPEMPIVIDEAAVEDILGVDNSYCSIRYG